MPGQRLAVHDEGGVARDDGERTLVLRAESLVAHASDGHTVDVGEGRAREDCAATAGAIAYDNCNAPHAGSLAFDVGSRQATDSSPFNVT